MGWLDTRLFAAAAVSGALALGSTAWAQRYVGTPPPVSGKNADSVAQITPADVLARTKLVLAEMEIVRREMGRPKGVFPPIPAKDTTPREVYSLAVALFERAERLAFEHTRAKTAAPRRPEGDVRPAHVWKAVDRALQQILLVKQEYGLKETAKEKLQADATTPTDVFKAMVQANRQINIMLERQIQPADVFQKVTIAVNYAERLLDHFSGAESIPPTPTFERGKTPLDVYRRLLRSFQTVSEIAQLSGHKMTNLNQDPAEVTRAIPSDVFDLASLLVSEMQYFHANLKSSRAPAPSFYPGRKFPSHVYQRVGILEAQLDQLHRLVKAKPDWIN